VENFATLCRGDTTHPRGAVLSYKNSFFHRIIPNFMIQVCKEIAFENISFELFVVS
jgi:cyclophilin family peptidyl-prolyl cis-trans isomerase